MMVYFFKSFSSRNSGRDIALSSNQSPVQKFFASMYDDFAEREAAYSGDLYPVRAMQLWNDWNVQAATWARTNPDKVEYLLVRSEDLLDPQRKPMVLKRLAILLGSPLVNDDRRLCCLAKKGANDYGKSSLVGVKNNIMMNGIVSDNVKNHNDSVQSRYGKWRTTLQKSPTLSLELHKHGKEGLSQFGYEPPKVSIYGDDDPIAMAPCDTFSC